MLSDYAKGKVTEEERNTIRKHLADNLGRLEELIYMIDNHPDLNNIVQPTSNRPSFSHQLSQLMSEVYPSFAQGKTSILTDLMSDEKTHTKRKSK